MSAFEYDVAFSFLAKDEGVATGICNGLEGRVRTFIYSRRQEELAGTDGQETFGRVFEDAARVVVIVLGAGWGERGWTLIEKTAIQNRGLRDGWDFLQVLPVDDGILIPKFIPKAHIYFDWNRWGTDGACSVIEAHVTRQGGQPTEPTFDGIASKKRREIELHQARIRFLEERNGTGIAWVARQVPALFAKLKEKAQASPLHLSAGERRNVVVVQGGGVRMAVTWQPRWADVLKESNLRVALDETSDWGSDNGKPIGKPFYFVADLDSRGDPAWRCEERWFSTDQLAEHVLIRMAEHMGAAEQ